MNGTTDQPPTIPNGAAKKALKRLGYALMVMFVLFGVVTFWMFYQLGKESDTRAAFDKRRALDICQEINKRDAKKEAILLPLAPSPNYQTRIREAFGPVNCKKLILKTDH